MRSVKQHTWLIITCAALFGLRGPLCVYACLETNPGIQVASAQEHPGERPPCHGGGSEVPEPSDSNDHECDCDRLRVIIGNTEAKKVLGDVEVPTPSWSTVIASLPQARTTSIPSGSWRNPLPPPDILLLHSTLLL